MQVTTQCALQRTLNVLQRNENEGHVEGSPAKKDEAEVGRESSAFTAAERPLRETLGGLRAQHFGFRKCVSVSHDEADLAVFPPSRPHLHNPRCRRGETAAIADGTIYPQNAPRLGSRSRPVGKKIGGRDRQGQGRVKDTAGLCNVGVAAWQIGKWLAW